MRPERLDFVVTVGTSWVCEFTFEQDDDTPIDLTSGSVDVSINVAEAFGAEPLSTYAKADCESATALGVLSLQFLVPSEWYKEGQKRVYWINLIRGTRIDRTFIGEMEVLL